VEVQAVVLVLELRCISSPSFRLDQARICGHNVVALASFPRERSPVPLQCDPFTQTTKRSGRPEQAAQGLVRPHVVSNKRAEVGDRLRHELMVSLPWESLKLRAWRRRMRCKAQ